MVSGADLGEIIALISVDTVAANKKINEIIEKQFVGNTNVPIQLDVDIISNFIGDNEDA